LRLTQQAYVALVRDQVGEAEDLLSKAVAKNPYNTRAHRELAEIRFRSGSPHKAIDDVLQSCPAEVRDVELNLCLAEMAAALERWDQAGDLVDQAIDLDPTRVESWLARARIHESRGNTADAMHAIQKAISLDPRDTAALCTLAEYYRRQGRPQESLATYHALRVRIGPQVENFAVLLGEGWSYLALGDQNAASTKFQAAAQVARNTIADQWAAAEALYAVGDWYGSQSCVERTLQLEPNHAMALALRDKLVAESRSVPLFH
jgi:tetratricopeptide (TPR) repeat protein